MASTPEIVKSYTIARNRYSEIGVDTDAVLAGMNDVRLSLHCWQGDDIGGFEKRDAGMAESGIQVTGQHPGKARTLEELQQDLEMAFSLIPGSHRLNLHAIYGDFSSGAVDRDGIDPGHFTTWVGWARSQGLKLDFNASCFGHPLATSGFTLSSKESRIRTFWIEHVRRCREISAYLGEAMGSACIHNLWIPDGAKDITVDRLGYRELLKRSLDEIYADAYPEDKMKDALESKLFGIGSESYVVGSHEFYLGYALQHQKLLCLDTGHFHPTESVADKISSLLLYFPELLLHISRGIRWDSDHVAILDDPTRDLLAEVVRGRALGRVHLALDFFDASMNRIGAWVIGARAVLKAVLLALLEPHDLLKDREESGDYFTRLALLEDLKTFPAGAVWDYHCASHEVAPDTKWLEEVKRYERDVTHRRK